MARHTEQYNTYTQKQIALKKQAEEYASRLGLGGAKNSGKRKPWRTVLTIGVPFLASFFIASRFILKKRKKKHKTFAEKLKSEPLIIRIIRQQAILYFFTFLKGIVLKYVQAYLNKDESETTQPTEDQPGER